jgi:hypothetical protein
MSSDRAILAKGLLATPDCASLNPLQKLAMDARSAPRAGSRCVSLIAPTAPTGANNGHRVCRVSAARLRSVCRVSDGTFEINSPH